MHITHAFYTHAPNTHTHTHSLSLTHTHAHTHAHAHSHTLTHTHARTQVEALLAEARYFQLPDMERVMQDAWKQSCVLSCYANPGTALVHTLHVDGPVDVIKGIRCAVSEVRPPCMCRRVVEVVGGGMWCVVVCGDVLDMAGAECGLSEGLLGGFGWWMWSGVILVGMSGAGCGLCGEVLVGEGV